MTSGVTLSGKDFGNERTSLGFFITTLTSANLDAELVKVQAVQDAINNTVLGTFNGKVVKAIDTQAAGTPIDPNAQRESKWRVTYIDNVDSIGDGSFEIGMPDLSLLVPGTGNMDVSGGAGAALVTALETNLVSRLDNPITVGSIVHVGRNI